MESISFLKKHRFIILLVIGIAAVAIWRPHAAIYGVQRGSLYSLIALPLSLTLGVIGVLNLAHGEFLTLGLYISWLMATNLGMDTLVSMIPAALILFALGALVYKFMISRVVKAGHLSQLLLTFGISMILHEVMNLIWTTRPRNVFVDYASSSIRIGNLRFGTYEFLYVAFAIGVLIALQLFLKKTRMGQATVAVGQNPRGAKVVGIDTGLVYLIVFGISIAILGLVAGVMIPRSSIFPSVGAPYTMISFCLVAMAGLGNLTGIVYGGIALGVAESIVKSIPGYGGWADLVFFGVLVVVIMIRTMRRLSL